MWRPAPSRSEPRVDPRAHANVCAACRANRCATCGVLGGRHNARRHAPRPEPAPRLDLVTADEVLEIYTREAGWAVRVATRLCGAASAPDVVQSVAVRMLARRPW